MMKKHKSGLLIAATALVILLGATLWFWRSSVQSSFEVASQRFEFRNADVTHAIAQRLDKYEQVLIAGAAFFEGVADVSRDDWRRYVEKLNLEERFPGIQGIGYAQRVMPDEQQSVIAGARASGYPQFTIWPGGDRPAYTTIVFLEPENWRNERAIGYDMFSNPERRAAMVRARDTGLTSATGIVSLVQEAGDNEQPGFLLYVPVYTGAEEPTTLAERRQRLRGYVYSPFRMRDLMTGILGRGSLPYRRLEIFEGVETTPDKRIYDSEAANRLTSAHDSLFVRETTLDFNGATWTLRYSSLPSFEASANIDQPRWLLIGGILFSFLMAGFIWALWINQRQGWALSTASRNLSYETSQREIIKEELQQFFALSPDILCTLNPDVSFRQINRACERILGFTSSALTNTSFLDRVHPDDRAPLMEKVEELKSRTLRRITHEARNLTASGDIRWIEWSFVAARHAPVFYGYGRDVTERKQLEQQLHHTAFHDKLTGAANRALFLDRLTHVIDRAHRFGESYAIFMMDIDNFKSINDSYGHPVGDKLLVAFAERIQHELRPVDTCARFGGDEFTLLIEETATDEVVRHLADRILAGLRPQFSIDGYEFHVGSSIGIAMGTAHSNYSSTEQVLKHADLALYEAKKQGKGRYVVFDERMQSEQLSKAQMEADLRQALSQHALQVFYQPIVDLRHGHIAGCEALVRWEHPILGKIGPDQFIPMAESTGLISHLGREVTEAACRALARWRGEGAVSADFFISVNLSPREFFLRDSMDYLKSSLEKYQLQGHNFCIEVTEGVLIERDEEASGIFSRLQSLGVKIFIDDFGTGYSSLSYLRTLPINGIKLDRSFIEQIRSTKKSREIARTVLELAKALDLQAIVEGVETDNQLQFVKTLGFGFAQGFGLYYPMSAQDLSALMRGHRRAAAGAGH